jgi:hypothetical protein
MIRAIVFLALVSQAPAAPSEVSVRVASGSPVYVNGITATTLYSGYWVPNEVIDPPSSTSPITDWDPQQSTFLWMRNEVAQRTDILNQLALLRLEYDSEGEKYGGAFTNSFYVDWATGNDSTGDGSIGNKWKTQDKAADYIKANHVDGGNFLDAPTEIVLSAGVQYITANGGSGTGTPPGGHARVVFDNIIGTAVNPLVVRAASGTVVVRIDHTIMDTYYNEYKDGTYDSDFGYHIKNETDYVQFWDLTMVGPLFEIPYTDAGGDSVAVHTSAYSGGGNIKIINCEITQWNHCGLKGKAINAYGNFIHLNGVSDSNHDHGIYLSEQMPDREIIGNIIINSDALSMVVREQNNSTGIKIVGNIMTNSRGNSIDIGGLNARIAHNVFEVWGTTSIQLGGQTRGTLVENNVFYSDNSISIHFASGSYIRATAYVWRTNAKLTATAAPTVTNQPVAHPGAGIAVTDKANLREANTHAYAAFTGGTTGATAPTHVLGETISDGGVNWTDIGTATESFGSFVNISASDFNAPTTFDFRPAIGSALLGAGTDVGYGDTIGAFNAVP